MSSLSQLFTDLLKPALPRKATRLASPALPGASAALAAAVRRLAADPATSRQTGQAGRICVEKNFSRGQLSHQLALILEEMI